MSRILSEGSVSKACQKQTCHFAGSREMGSCEEAPREPQPPAEAGSLEYGAKSQVAGDFAC